jgi:hypothetical protein
MAMPQSPGDCLESIELARKQKPMKVAIFMHYIWRARLPE